MGCNSKANINDVHYIRALTGSARVFVYGIMDLMISGAVIIMLGVFRCGAVRSRATRLSLSDYDL